MKDNPPPDILAKVQNIHIYPSDLKHASRIFRIARALEKNRVVGPICLVGMQKFGTLENEKLTDGIWIWRVPVKNFRIASKKIHKILRYANWLSRIVGRFSKAPVQIINCHSLFDLPAGALLKLKSKCLLVYDTHELETERNGLKGLLKVIFKIVEKLLVPYCDQIFVVSDSIGSWYKSHYPRQCVLTIQNIPPAEHLRAGTQDISLRALLKIPQEHLIFLYLGLLHSGRGIDLLIDVFSASTAAKHLVLIGYGPLAEPIRRRIRDKSNIHLLAAVPPDMVLAYAKAADVGLALIENTCLSYYYCLPNKMHEYHQAGLPCITSDFPEMSDFTKKYKCGWKTAVEKEAFSRLVDSLSRAKIEALRNNMRRFDSPPRWADEEKKLLAAYAALLEKKIV
jgi:glycosyltransferase involved in cell wall biosynthesis